jgi:hypothetical protein
MRAKFKFRLSALTLGVMGALVGGQAMAADTYQDLVWSNGNVEIRGSNDNSPAGEGVFIRSNAGDAAAYANFYNTGVINVVATSTEVRGLNVLYLTGDNNINLTSALTAISQDATVGETLSVTGATTLSGATTINNTLAVNGDTTVVGVTRITGATTVTGATSITGTTNINAGSTNTTNIGTGTSASVNNIGGAASTNTITGASNTIAGATSINASVNAATTINTGSSTGAVTVGNQQNITNLNSATNNIGVNGFATTNNIGTGSNSFASTNLIGNTNAGTTAITTAGNSVVTTKNNAASTVVTGASGTSNLDGGTTTSGGSAVLLKGGTGTQTVVDANGKLTTANGTATQSTAALTLTNGLGNTHGVVVTESQTTLSGGTQSSSMTLNDRAATFSNAQTGAPITVTGVANGSADFDAVNVRQFAGAIAAVTAAANIPAPEAGKSSAFGVGVGNFMGKSALSLGLVHRTEKGPMLKFSVSGGLNDGGQTPTVGMGAGWSW